jgi:enoyl-CoA hydratase
MPVTIESIEGEFALLKVDRPQVRNALNFQAMADFADCIEQAHLRQDLRALILTGEGESFIAGGDLKELHNYNSQSDAANLMKLVGNALNRLEALPCPTIAAINGPARGGGAEIALACDFRVMSADADLGLAQITLGLTPGWGAGGRLLRLVGYSRAMDLLMTGRVLDAQEAHACGLVNRIAPPGEVLFSALELAHEIGRMPAAAVEAIKRILRAGVMLPAGAANALERSEFPPLWAAEEHRMAVQRFLNRSDRK